MSCRAWAELHHGRLPWEAAGKSRVFAITGQVTLFLKSVFERCASKANRGIT